MAQRQEADIIVAGTGPAGLISALLAHQAGFRTLLAGPPTRLDDARTTALMNPAIDQLRSIGIEPGFDGSAAPLKTMRIIDATNRLLRSPVVTFHAAEIGEDCFGWNIPNAALNAALASAVEQSGIEWRQATVAGWELTDRRAIAILQTGDTVEALLAVGADGRNSPAREAAGITIAARQLPQSAFVTTMELGRSHQDISTEFHTETGPFTVVPLPGLKASLVWVVRPDKADDLLAMDSPILERAIEDRMQSMLGKVSVIGARQGYPLSTGLPSAFANRRVALVGEAAHFFPPIGAQGLNLGIRDAADLIRSAVPHRTDPGAPAALASYEAARRPDVLARTGAVSLLNRSLLSDFLPAQFARSAGLVALSGMSPLRGFFMREGMRPGSGFENLLSALRKEVRR